MNIYIPLIIIGLSFSVAILVSYRNGRQMTNRIHWLQDLVEKQNENISSLHDRLMAKSLNEYQMWKRTPDEVPPPPEPEEEFDESSVGHVSGEETGIAES